VPDYLKLKGIKDIKESTLNNEIQDGIIEYFDWALLGVGNYYNVTYAEQSPYDQDYSKLRLSSDPNYSEGQVWEGFRSNWVWQSGIDYSPAPLVSSDNTNPGVSGIYVDGVFHANDSTGTYAHHIDHYNGKVIFDSAIPTGSVVQAEFSYKWINVVYANDVPWLREVQTDSMEPTSSFYEKDKGDWNIPPEARLQLPAVAVEIVPMRSFKGFRLGGGQWIYTDVIFHCIAEDEMTRNKLVDIISLQSNKTIFLINSNSVSASGDYPIDYRGVPVSGALRYPDLLNKHVGLRLRFTDTTVENMTSVASDIYGGIVRFKTELINLKI
jgi:hypothetical protein